MASIKLAQFEVRKVRRGLILKVDFLDNDGEHIYDDKTEDYLSEETVLQEPLDPKDLGEQIIAMMVEARMEAPATKKR